MRKMIRSYSVLLLFLLMSITIFSKPGKGHGHVKKKEKAKKETTIIVTGLIEKGEVTLKNHHGGGNKIEDLSTNFLKESSELVIKFTGNKAKSLYVTETGYFSKKLDKEGNTYTYSLRSKTAGKKILLTFEVRNGRGGGGGATDYIYVNYTIPRPIENIKIKTYEEIYGWENGERTTIDDSGRTYIYTKGGDYFHTSKPIVYVEIPEDNIDEKGEVKITELKVEKLNSDGSIIREKNFEITESMRNREIELDFIKEGANIVRVTPIAANKYNIDKTPKILNFIVDTKINSSYLDNEDIIGELKAREISIRLSKFGELSGINKYSYTLSNGFQREGKERTVDGSKYLTPTEDGKLNDVKIQLGNFSEGSRLTLAFTVYDRLGHEKTYEKTYFMPKQSDGIAAKVSGEVKQRRSKIKIITEGNKEKFGVGSSIDGSSEEDETSISGS